MATRKVGDLMGSVLRTVLTLTALAVVLPACVAYSSLHGIPESARGELDATYLGEWYWEGGADRATFSVTADGVYEVLANWEDEGEPFEARLSFEVAEIGKDTILDVTLAKSERKKLMARYNAFVVPTHVFLRLNGDGENVTLRCLDGDWVQKNRLGDSNGFADSALTLGPDDVLELLKSAAGNDEAWEKDQKFVHGEIKLTRHVAASTDSLPLAVQAHASGFEFPIPGSGPDLLIEREGDEFILHSDEGYFWSDVVVAGDNTSVFATRNRGSLRGFEYDSIVQLSLPIRGPLSASEINESLNQKKLEELLPGWRGAQLDAVSTEGTRLLLRLGLKEQRESQVVVIKYLPYIYDLRTSKLEAVTP